MTAKQKHRARNRPALSGPRPEMFEVQGTDRHGEAIRAEYWKESDAERVAAGVNRRGGNVTVVRLVWNSPAAGWREPSRYGEIRGDRETE